MHRVKFEAGNLQNCIDCLLLHYANLAQPVEHFIRNERAVSSNLIVGSTPYYFNKRLFANKYF